MWRGRPRLRPPSHSRGRLCHIRILLNWSTRMPDPNSPSHWDLLASNLGAASPPPEEPSRQPGPVPSQQPPAQKPARHRSATSPPPANWDAVASQLGLAPTAPIASPPPIASSPATVAKAIPVVPPPLPEQGRRPSTPPEISDESPNFFDERFDFEEPFDLLESSELPAVEAESTIETTEPTEEKRPRRRRRRRRRGRGGEQRESRVPETAAEGGSTNVAPGSDDDFAREPGEGQPEGTSPPQARDEGESDESGEQRSRRRRSRRGQGRRDSRDQQRPVGEVQEAPADSGPAELYDEEMGDVDLLGDDDLEPGEGDQVDGDQPARLGFRGIPTWDEVVGMLIDKNLEARARRPAGGPYHGRGNRGPRDNRGGNGGRSGDGGRGGDKRHS
jgi:hypothetical protein